MSSLVRLARSLPSGPYVGRGEGRGVWCCPTESCVASLSTRAISKALRGEVKESEVERWRELLRRTARWDNEV